MPTVHMEAPPGWGDDSLTDFIKGSTENAWATYMQPDTRPLFERARDIDAAFVKATELMTGQTPQFVEALMLVNACCAYRSAVQLAMEAKSCETYALIRSCLEYALVGTYMHKHPGLIEVWMKRGETPDNRKAVRKAFQTGAMLTNLDGINNAVGERVRNLYELSIDYGAHPNEQGFFGRLTMDKKDNGDVHFQVVMSGNAKLVPLILKNAAQSGIIALEAFRLIYKERFDIMGLSAQMDALKPGL